MIFKRLIGLSALCAALQLSVSPAAIAQAPGGKAPPPAKVTIEAVQPKTVPVTYDYAARVSAFKNVQVRARVGGILMHRNFVEGTEVKAGDILFEIDPAPYEAELEKAQAQVAQAQAQYEQSIRDAERAEQLVQQRVQSTAVRDSAVATRDLNKAAVAAAQAQLKTAQLNLGYTKVTAPISGITSQEQVSEGSLIGTDATSSLLTSITQLDPVYINFSFTDSEAAEVRKILDAQAKSGKDPAKLKVQISFGDGTTYDHEGVIDFTSSTLDTETGTIGARAIVDNPDRRLIPGQFVRANVLGVSIPDAITIPAGALMQNAQGQFVFLVGEGNKVEIRPVAVAKQLGENWLVSKGLNAGDKVITEGVIKARPGSEVDPSPAAQPAADAAGNKTAPKQ